MKYVIVMRNSRLKFIFDNTQYSIILFLLIFVMILSGCSKDENTNYPPDPEPVIEPSISITNINNLPANVLFDRIEANITGECWSIIGTVEAKYENGQAVIKLPTSFTNEQLQIVDRRDNNMCGYWPAESSDPDALVATLGDIIAYQGTNKVGRVYLSNWSGKGTTAGKVFVYFQYADRPFSLSGSNNSYYYSDCKFKKGWNSYANINPIDEGTSENIRCTTTVPEDIFWCFESWVF